MKNLVIAVLLAATVGFAGLYLHQSRKVVQGRIAADKLEQKTAELQSTVEDQQKKSANLRAELARVRADAVAEARQVAQSNAAFNEPAPAANSVAKPGGSSGGGPSNPFSSFAKMFDDPEIKEAITIQQRNTLGPMIDKTYGKLFSDLRLAGHQTNTLKEMLLNKQLAGAQMGMSMLSEGSDPSKTAELTQRVKAAADAADGEIKTFLGEEKFAQLKAYEKTVADRMAINGFKEQLSADNALTTEQEEQLVRVMTHARENFKFTTDLSDKSKIAGDFPAVFNEQNMNRLLQELDQLNQHFIGYAQNILTPNQLDSFQKHLNSQHALQKAGMQMGAKMFAPAKQPQSE